MSARLDRLLARARRARFAATPLYAWPLQARRALGRSKLGSRLKTAWRVPSGIEARQAERPMRLPRRRNGGRNVVLVSHCDFTGNSAYHVHAIACELYRRGWSPVMLVPGRPRGHRELGRSAFPVLSFNAARRRKLTFPDGGDPDLVHAFTPREPVRRTTLDVVHQFGCPYVVHLEDNELAVRRAVARGYDPVRGSRFLAEASGVTAVVEKLLEFKPAHVPGAVVWPGYDADIDLGRSRESVRRDIGLDGSSLAVVYTGNVHLANADHVAELYEAVRAMRHDGANVVLVKTGWNSIPAASLPRLGDGIIDLGWIRRRHVFELLRAADVLVQPGTPGPFDDYRFPSKLPEFLAAGRPVVLPRTNIGLHLRDGVEALLLERGDAAEIRAKIELLAADAEMQKAIGQRGREFAVRELQWSRTVSGVESVYDAARFVRTRART